MSEPRVPDGEVSWPVRLSAAELTQAFRGLGFEVDPASPVAPLLGEAIDGAEVAPPVAPLIARALLVLALPRQLLLVRPGPRAGGGVLGFLASDRFVVRFDAGEDGCIIAEPCELDRFGWVIAELAGASDDLDRADDVAVSARFLEIVVALRDAGLLSEGKASLGRPEAEAAVADATDLAVEPGELLEMLERDGLLTVDGSRVGAQPEWIRRYPYLATPALLKIEAIEIADLAAGRPRPKGLAVLGERAERVVLIPPGPGRERDDMVLELRAATPLAVAETVARLLEPPLAPPYSPIADLGSVTPKWLGDEAGSDFDPEWKLQTAEELIMPGADDDAPPSSLLTPQATVEVVSWRRGGADVERTVVALDDDGAAEWTLDGSLVRWGALPIEHLVERIRDLLPAHHAPAAPPTDLLLSTSDVECLLLAAGAAQRGESPPPAQLSALVDDAEIRWCMVRAGHRADGQMHDRVLMLASSPTAGTWRLAPEGEGLLVEAVAAEEVHAEVLGALSPPGRPVPAFRLNGGGEGRAGR